MFEASIISFENGSIKRIESHCETVSGYFHFFSGRLFSNQKTEKLQSILLITYEIGLSVLGILIWKNLVFVYQS